MSDEPIDTNELRAYSSWLVAPARERAYAKEFFGRAADELDYLRAALSDGPTP